MGKYSLIVNRKIQDYYRSAQVAHVAAFETVTTQPNVLVEVAKWDGKTNDSVTTLERMENSLIVVYVRYAIEKTVQYAGRRDIAFANHMPETYMPGWARRGLSFGIIFDVDAFENSTKKDLT